MTKRINGSGHWTVCCRIRNFSLGPTFLSVFLLGSWLLGSGAGFAEPPGGPDEVASTVEQIRALRDQIAALLATLPPEVRQDLSDELRFDAAVSAPEPPKPEPSPAIPPVPADPAPSVTPPSTSPAEGPPSPPMPDPAPPSGSAEPPVLPSAEGQKPSVPGPRTSSPTGAGSPQTARDGQSEAPPKAPRSGRRCEFLAALDTNGDGQIDALDRYWRHLFVWRDRNGDGTPQENEIRSAYEAGVRTLTTDADTFTRKKGSLGEIRQRDGEIWLDLRGDGFASDREDGVLMFDATALARRGGPGLFSAAGQRLAGMEPVRQGMEIRPDGEPAQRLGCP